MPHAAANGTKSAMRRRGSMYSVAKFQKLPKAAVFWKPVAVNKRMVFKTAVPILLKYIELYHLWQLWQLIIRDREIRAAKS